MRRLSQLVAHCALLACLSPLCASAQQMKVCFTPGEPCESMIVDAVDSARTSVLVQAYSFTSPAIGKALAAAFKRGVDVRVIVDKSQRTERYSGATYLAHAGIPVLVDTEVAIAHNNRNLA